MRSGLPFRPERRGFPERTGGFHPYRIVLALMRINPAEMIRMFPEVFSCRTGFFILMSGPRDRKTPAFPDRGEQLGNSDGNPIGFERRGMLAGNNRFRGIYIFKIPTGHYPIYQRGWFSHVFT